MELKQKIINNKKLESFANIVKSGVYLRYRHCFKLFKKLRKDGEFWQQCYRNSTKVCERKRKSGKEKILNFDNHIIEIFVIQTC